MTKLKAIFPLFLTLLSLARASTLVESSPSTGVSERRLAQICNSLSKIEGDDAIWGPFFAENASEDVRNAITGFNVEADCGGSDRVTLTISLLNAQTQIDLYIMEDRPEKSSEGTEFKFNCYTFESRFGDNNFFSAQCVEVMEEGDVAIAEIKKRIREDLANMLRYIVARMKDPLTADMVAGLLQKHWEETYELGVTNPDLMAAVKAVCPGDGGLPQRYKVANQNQVETPGKLSYQLTLNCGTVSVQLTADIFLIDGNYVRVRVGTSNSLIEFDWAIFDQSRIDKIDAANPPLKTKDLILEEFNQNHKAQLDAFLDSALVLSANDKTKLAQSQLTYPEFVSLLDKVLITTAEREKDHAETQLVHVTRVNLENLATRPAVHNIEESQDLVGDDAESKGPRRFTTFEPFDYFLYLTEEPKPGVVNFGKFFGEIDLAQMSQGKAGLYCTRLGIEKGCEVGKPLDPEVIQDQIARFHQNLVTKTNLADENDKEAGPFAPKNVNDYFPIEMAYSIDEIFRVLLVKTWQLSASCLSGAIILFKTQFFVLEYIVPFLDAETTQSILGFLVDNVLDHYAQTVADTHEEVSKPTVYTLEEIKKEVGVSLNQLGKSDHVCATKVSGNGVDSYNVFEGKDKGGKPVGKDGEIADCEGIESDEMTAIVRVQTAKDGPGFELQVLLNHESASGLPMSTKYRINKTYPYQYNKTLESYLTYMLGLIKSKKGKRYDLNKNTMIKMLGKKEAKPEELRTKRILKEKIVQKLTKQRQRIQV